MKNGIGPQSLGAPGTSPNSKPCGTPLDFNEKLRSQVGKGTLNPGFEKAIEENNKTKNLRKNYNCFSAIVPDSQWQKQCNKQYLKSFKNYKPNMAFPNK